MKLLVVDDDEDVLLAASMLLKKHYPIVHTLSDPEKLLQLHSREKYDLILLDMNFTRDTSSGNEGFFFLRNLIIYKPDTKVVLFTAYGNVEKAVKAIKAGACDFILKPWDNDKLLAVVGQVLNNGQSLKSRNIPEPVHLVGQSPALSQVLETARKAAATEATVLIRGENGTGKELIARELHRLSKRCENQFVSVDLGSLSESLFESELFGHVKGAFTDAKEDKTGRFEEASGGTIFLDEIGNLSLTQQAKLLTVLQNRSIQKVGSGKLIALDLRIICATNAPLAEMITNRTFRQDLLYRINTVEITLPPLRERKEDIPALAEHFLQFFASKYDRIFKKLSPATIALLKKHGWPGNIRELRHTIERAVILSDGDDIYIELPEQSSDEKTEDLNLDMIERNVIQKSLKKHNGNISKTAEELGLTRAALYRRIEKYSL